MQQLVQRTKSETSSGTQVKRRYCLYFHHSVNADEVVYCGIGTLDRPWQVRNRQPEHTQWLIKQYDQYGSLEPVVTVEVTNLSKEEALESELEYIDRVRPIFNRNYSNPLVKLTEEGFFEAKRLRDLGYSYSKISQELKISTMAAYRALNKGVKAYDKYE